MGNVLGDTTFYNPIGHYDKNDGNVYTVFISKLLIGLNDKTLCCLKDNDGSQGMRLNLLGTDGRIYKKILRFESHV